MRDFTGHEFTSPPVELFKGMLAYLILRDVPALNATQALEVVLDVLDGHGTESVTARGTLTIIDEAMGAAHAAADRLTTHDIEE